MAEVELLRDGEEVPKQARLEINSRRLSIAWEAGLGRRSSAAIASVESSRFGQEELRWQAAQQSKRMSKSFANTPGGCSTRTILTWRPSTSHRTSSGTAGPSAPLRGLRTSSGLLRGFIGALPDLNAQEQDIVAQGDMVAVRFVVEATHEGELLGIAPTGRRVRWDAVDVYRLRDGKITEEWAADDLTAILHQVGAYTPPWLS